MTHILIIDDHDIFRTWMRVALELEGYAVEEACDGR
jgi:CheY-like chemotaxis protein